ncbi:hypothetical protein PMKS-003300 [Pichia membranifaciens]|uniref:ubiquitinyl hydrolase 1 n=1 Tax=Pichia membranifaciens TaxID=4926 RepID=A0A1Q2YJQ6_9ASCO|nr:hypothetical protein PMKS-003300 [Pichia membranifaciens]
MHPRSNSHTPLLSSGTVPDNDIGSITDMEDLDEENNEKENDSGDQSPRTERRDVFNLASKGETTEAQEDEIDQEMNSLPENTPFRILELRRERFRNTQVKKQTGLKYYYIDRDWLMIFLNKDFKPDDILIDSEIGPVRTIPFDHTLKGIDDSFIVLDKFKLLLEWFQLEKDNQLIERELVFSTTENKFIIDLHPLTIIPHIFCNNASQVNRFNQIQNRNHKFQISSYRTVADLFNCMLSYFDLTQINVSSTRIWCVEFESTHNPLVVLPSTMKFVGKRKLVNKKRKKSATLRQRHINSCHLMIEIKQPDGIFFLDVDSHVLPGSGLVGLNNLGNTCYMNSALQCLVHIPELNSYFLYHFFENELNKDNPLGNKGKVAISFGSLVTSLFDTRFHGNQSSFSPKEFKYTIGHFNSLFADYRQQDSQEFIAYLLDGLHEDLNRVLKKPYVEKPELEVGKEDSIEAIKNLAEKCWEAHKMRNNSVIVDLFVALYKSTLICPVCDRVSITFDPYNDLTLPLPITKKWTHKIKILPENGNPKIFEAQLNRNETYSDLKRLISKYMDIPEDNLIGVEIFRSSIYKNFEDSTSDSRYLPISELISSGEDIWFYEVEQIEGNASIPVFSTVVSNNNRNNFCLPFFISLSPEDRFSYGEIQRKMVKKYKQLSTSELFVKIDESDYGVYTAKDFEGIELFFKYLGVNTPFNQLRVKNEVNESNADKTLLEENVPDDDDKSTISFASPEYTLENIFSSKIVDSSLEKSYYGPNAAARSLERSASNNIKSSLDFWFPRNHNTIIKHDLPSLLDGISITKKCYYLYGPENLRLLKEHYEKLESEQVKCKDQDAESVSSKQKDSLPSDNVEMLDSSDTSNIESRGVEDAESECDMDEELKDFTRVQKHPPINTNDDIDAPTKEQDDGLSIDRYFTATEIIESGKSEDILQNSANVLQPGNNNDKLVLSSSSSISPVSTSSGSSLSVPSSSSPSIAKDACSVTNDSSEDRKPLIEPMSAIVNEFREDSFDLCFCNPSNSPFSGSETWSSPEMLVNDDLERERKENLENSKKPVTLYDCLELFSKPETLGENDLWYCPQCKEHRQATKKIELWSAPDILTIHLKRFESTQSFSDKIDIVVDFPIEGLDLNKFVADQTGEHIYDLFAVDNHYGGLGGGHYTAYVNNFADGKWHYFNDSRITPVADPTESITGNAYLLFYRKRSQVPLGGAYFQNMMVEIQKRNNELRKAIDDSQVEQASSNSTLETSDEEMHTSEMSESSESFEESQPGNGGTADRNTNDGNDKYDDDSDIDTDDGNKRRKLGVSSTVGESICKSRGNEVATFAGEESASSTDTNFTPISN